MVNNEDVARAFINGVELNNSNKSFFVERINGVIVAFSYGEHFPISLSFRDGFLFNKDGYSNTTSRHKNLILNEIKHELSEGDYKNTKELRRIVENVRLSKITTKAQIILNKI